MSRKESDSFLRRRDGVHNLPDENTFGQRALDHDVVVNNGARHGHDFVTSRQFREFVGFNGGSGHLLIFHRHFVRQQHG